ncbi:MAG: glutaredoxin domain-containing protein [Rhodoferax sp.]
MMTRNTTTSFLLGSAVLLCTLGIAQAQAVYRIVGPDGKVTFSDKPPVTASQGKVATTGTGAAAASSGSGSLPYELRQVVNKYPVVLYTSSACAPCDAGRSALTSRGVPFSERTVTTNEDKVALQRLTNDASLPYLTIGGQKIKGYSDLEWTQYLDAAGYPKTSALPANYRSVPAAPLVAVQVAAPAGKSPAKTPAASEEPTYQAPPTTPSNPAGITF